MVLTVADIPQGGQNNFLPAVGLHPEPVSDFIPFKCSFLLISIALHHIFAPVHLYMIHVHYSSNNECVYICRYLPQHFQSMLVML